MKKTVLILSGGLDSTCLLYELLKDGDKVECLNFSYGSKHNERERSAAQHVAFKAGVKLHYIDLPFIGNLFKSALLFSGDKIPEEHYQEENMKQTVVPFRNAIMLSIAGGYAASIKFDQVSAGIHLGDHAIYPDCRVEFFDVFKDLLRVGLWEHVNFYAPYVWIDKTEIATRGYKLGAPIYETYSCYNGGEKHCGKCGACNERKEALKPLGKDLTIYESEI